MLMNWSSPFNEEKRKKKITNPKQLEQVEDELMDYVPPKEKKEPEKHNKTLESKRPDFRVTKNNPYGANAWLFTGLNKSR